MKRLRFRTAPIYIDSVDVDRPSAAKIHINGYNGDSMAQGSLFVTGLRVKYNVQARWQGGLHFGASVSGA